MQGQKHSLEDVVQVKNPIDIMLSHDWPRGVYYHGNTEKLLRTKKFLRNEVQTNTLGNPMGEMLLHSLQPRFWFAGTTEVPIFQTPHVLTAL